MTPFQPTASWNSLRRRAELLKAIRAFFDQRGFLEVETPLLSRDVVVDEHIDPIPVALPTEVDEHGVSRPTRWWLQTSPEAAMKRLMACGGQAIYQITRSFRRGEQGRLHNPEFTIVEWYHRDDDRTRAVDRLDALMQTVLQTSPAVRLEYRQAFRQHLDIDPWHDDDKLLREAAERRGLHIDDDSQTTRDELLDFLLAEGVIPQFDGERPTVLWGYPATQAALARVDEAEPRRAERFELFYRGLELANGYVELTDAAEWERRAAAANGRRRAAGREPLPVAGGMLDAMRAGLPPCAGVALGFDRLVMADLATNDIARVIAFPWDRA